jgi:dihydroorotate dehydrogenase
VLSITGGKLPLIGVGGISSGEEAYKRIRAGASLVQIYTGLAYEGPYAVPGIKWRMEELARADGFETVNQAVGADVKGLFPVGSPNQGLHHTFSTWFSRPDSII